MDKDPGVPSNCEAQGEAATKRSSGWRKSDTWHRPVDKTARRSRLCGRTARCSRSTMAETRTDLETAVKPSTDPFIIEFISATDIPLYDGKSKSDPFIQAYISAHVEKLDALNRRVFSLQRVSNLVQTPRRLDCTAVTWHCYRDFNVKPSTEAILTVELYHHNKDAQKGVPLGKIDIPVGKFVDDEPIKFPLYVVKVGLNATSCGGPQLIHPFCSLFVSREQHRERIRTSL